MNYELLSLSSGKTLKNLHNKNSPYIINKSKKQYQSSYILFVNNNDISKIKSFPSFFFINNISISLPS